MANKNSTYTVTFSIGGKVSPSLENSVKNASGMLGDMGRIGGLAGKTIAAGIGGLAVSAIGKLFSKAKEFITESIELATEYENAMADVAKVVDGLKDEAGNTTAAYEEMSSEILDLSTKIPMEATDIAAIVAAAGQSNIASDELVRFAEDAAKMGIAFDTTAEQAGEWMAVWRTSLRMTQDEVVELSDQINYLGNTSPGDAQKLSQIVTDVGSLGQTAGFSAAEIAALGAATSGVETSVASTGIKKLVNTMSKGESVSERQESALKKLGISATQMSKRMQTDAQGAVLDLLDALNKLPRYQQVSLISDFFGEESLSTITKLTGNVENLREQFDKINDSKLYDGSMEAEFHARTQTYDAQRQLLQNTWDAFKIDVGTDVLKALTDILVEVTPALKEALPGIADKLKEVIGSVTSEDINNFADKVADFIPKAADFIENTLTTLPQTIQEVKAAADLLLGPVKDIYTFATGVLNAFAGLAELFSTGKLSARTINGLVSKGANLAGFNYVGGTQTAGELAGKTAPSDDFIGPMPQFAEGGIVTQSMIAEVGEGGEPEAIFPLSKLEKFLSATNSADESINITYAPTIHVGADASEEEVHESVQKSYEEFKIFMDRYLWEKRRKKF